MKYLSITISLVFTLSGTYLTDNPGKPGKDKLESISWISPEDGGTPRDLSRIREIGKNVFQIDASFEDGGISVLKHPVSRMDLICLNSSSRSVKVKLHLDLSDNGNRPDFDNKPEAGMPDRDFIFIQSPGDIWNQINGSTDGFASIVSFDAHPGETKVGLNPWYNYGDYLNFVNKLTLHPHLKRDMIGKSDGNREHWELTITNPDIPDNNKHKIFWHCREHGYETLSSFAMEGLAEYLLSDASAEFRNRYIFILHPILF